MKHKNHNTVLITVIVISVVFFLIFSALISFFQFTSIGYRMSVPFRSSFEKIDDNVYINKLDPDEKEEITMITEIINKAKERVADFYGELKSSENTVIILCDNKNTLEKLGGDHDTQTAFFPSVKNYISLSPDYFNINILAHELTHAELHTRLSSSVMKKLPVWFNEGLAMQNDNRKTYNEDAWRKLTDDGKKTVALTDMDEESEFYAGTDNDKLMRYVCAKHEVSEWMSRHGRQGLLELIDNLNNGEDFYTVYTNFN